MKYFLGILICSALGSWGLEHFKSSSPSSFKTIEWYWQDTGLGPELLYDVLRDENCVSSEKYYIACANAYLKIINLKNSNDSKSDKQALQHWIKLNPYLEQLKNPFPFLKKIESIFADIPSVEQAYVTAIGINGFLSLFKDPHTYILPFDYFNDVVANPKNQLPIGILFSEGIEGITIKKVFKNSPAELAGLKKGDVIWSINGKVVKGLSLKNVSPLFHPVDQSIYTLSILREKKIKVVELDMTPAKKEIPAVHVSFIKNSSHVMVIGIDKFAKQSCKLVQTAIEKNPDVQGIILDLRDNPGGQIDEAACIAGLFLPYDALLFELKFLSANTPSEKYYNEHKKIIYKKALAIIINQDSASSAELLAGTLQDYQRALIVGQTSFGKGSFQEGQIWTKNSRVVLFETQGFYYLPSGETPQLTGVIPDLKIGSSFSEAGSEKNAYLNPLKPLPSSFRFEFLSKNLNIPHWSNCLFQLQKKIEITNSIIDSTGIEDIITCINTSEGSQRASREF